VRDIDMAIASYNLITHDSDAPKSKRIAYIGTNNYQAGRTLGEEIKRLLPKGGKMAVFVGTLAADNARERLRGIEDVVSKANIQIVAKKEDNKDPNKARSNVEDVITAHGDIDLLAGLWSYNGPAILSAVTASGKQGKIKIVAFDEEDATLQGIEQGSIECTVVQKPFEFGYRSALLLKDLCNRGRLAVPRDPIIDTGVEVVNKANVKDFKVKLAELKK
jgi:ribose transport system substrate-binding protein